MKLYGIALSNYTNMVRTALAEKGLDYEFVIEMPNQGEEYLARSPMGKVPCLEVDGTHLTETSAILDYLEELQPAPALLPSDPLARAKVRELCQAFGLYVELVARKGIGAIFGKEMPDHIKKGMARDLPRGLKAVGQLTQFSPYVAGSEFTYADLYAYYTMTLANMLAQTNCEMDLFEQLPGSKDWYDMLSERDSIKAANADMAEQRAKMAS